MAFEYISNVHDPLYPIVNGQDERILIEYDGILHSEAEKIFYGIKDCPILEAYPFKTYYRLQKKPPIEIYEEIGYFRPADLLIYLNDGNNIEADELNALIEYACLNYDYEIATPINMLGAMLQLITADYIKGITIVIPPNQLNILLYLIEIFGEEKIKNKVSLLEASNNDIIDKMKEELLEGIQNNFPYTTVITNEYKLILDVLSKYKKYKADTMLFLLRNHSQNMKQSIKDKSVVFNELYTDDIVNIINGNISSTKQEILDFPAKAKFGRFNPVPFITDSPAFMTFGDIEESSTKSKEE